MGAQATFRRVLNFLTAQRRKFFACLAEKIGMPQVKPPFETFARIKVVGVGGGGNNAVSRMLASRIYGVEFLAINTDAQDLHHTTAREKLHIGKNVTRGLGAGMDPELGRQSAEESRQDIEEALKGVDLIFITGGLGGGTGSGAAPVIAGIARDAGALTVGVITKPFSFEGAQRSQIAEDAWLKLRDEVDAIITIPNDRLLHLIDRRTPILDAFGVVDDILRQAVQGISNLITTPGLINLDFADVKAIMEGAGLALMGIGRASGDDRAVNAARSAINSPLLDLSIAGASRVLFSVSGGPDLTMAEVHDAAKIITESIAPNAKVIFGASHDDHVRKF